MNQKMSQKVTILNVDIDNFTQEQLLEKLGQVSLGLMLFAYFGNKLKMIEQIGYGLILSGAMGNGLDRFIQGYVIDFLDFRLIHFPIFNIADICINLGIICLLLAGVMEKPNKRNIHKK